MINSRCHRFFTILSLVVLGIFLIFPGASADEGNTQPKKDAGQLTPPGTFQELPSLPPPTPENQGAINPRTGEHYPPSGKGVINPRTGEYYPPSGQGFINPRTGAYYPHAIP